ncbi:MAG: hypothetical protein P8P40_02860, partial [Sulfitobacter sp.]|nr:hypothetical protein [Sulfitobacter sp.]
DQARYLIATAPENAAKLISAGIAAGLTLAQVGTFGGDTLAFGTSSAQLADLCAIYASSFANTVT